MKHDRFFVMIEKDHLDMDKLEQFVKDHEHGDVSFGAIGGHMQTIITHTSIGEMVTIKCTHCGEECDVNDYSWF